MKMSAITKPYFVVKVRLVVSEFRVNLKLRDVANVADSLDLPVCLVPQFNFFRGDADYTHKRLLPFFSKQPKTNAGAGTINKDI
jgi:hypothetical protein